MTELAAEIANADGKLYASLGPEERDRYDSIARRVEELRPEPDPLEFAIDALEDENRAYKDGAVDGFELACEHLRRWLYEEMDESRLEARRFQAFEKARRHIGDLRVHAREHVRELGGVKDS